jgi:hypothetical protein
VAKKTKLFAVKVLDSSGSVSNSHQRTLCSLLIYSTGHIRRRNRRHQLRRERPKDARLSQRLRGQHVSRWRQVAGRERCRESFPFTPRSLQPATPTTTQNITLPPRSHLRAQSAQPILRMRVQASRTTVPASMSLRQVYRS